MKPYLIALIAAVTAVALLLIHEHRCDRREIMRHNLRHVQGDVER